MKELFNIENTNVLKDEENYYFFRALNMADNKDYEEKIIIDKFGKINLIRTDLDRFEENNKNQNPKYSQESKISMEQFFDHIKKNYRKDTKCISLSTNANISLSYGKNYKDKYIIVKVPKKELGKKVINAGEYLLKEIEKRIKAYIEILEKSSKENALLLFDKIDKSNSITEISKLIKVKYKLKNESNFKKLEYNKKDKYINKKINLNKIEEIRPVYIMYNCEYLNENQNLERNKIIAKLVYLERFEKMPALIKNFKNNNSLIQAVNNAFSSLEYIHYGRIKKEEIIETSKEYVANIAEKQLNKSNIEFSK